MPPQIPQSHPPTAAADDAEEESDTDAAAQALEMRSVSRSPAKPAAAAGPQPEFDADEEEDGDSSESDPEVPEPVPKKAAGATGKSKTVEDKKRPAPAPAPSGSAKKKAKADTGKAAPEATLAGKGKKAKADAGKATPAGKGKKAKADAGKATPAGKGKKAKADAGKATPAGKGKKAKADTGKAAPEATPAGKGKKANAEAGKAAPEATPAGKGKKAKADAGKAAPEATPADKGKKAKADPEKLTPVQTPSARAKKLDGKQGKLGLDSSSSSKSEEPARAQCRWSKEDSMKILEALAAHVKSKCEMPKTGVILAAVRGSLDRKKCEQVNMYEKVRSLNKRYQKLVSNGVMPSGEDELKMYHLSDAIWGEKATEAIAAAASRKASSVAKSKKGQAKKQKVDGNSKGGTVKEVANQDSDTHKRSNNSQTDVEADRNVKSKLLKETATTATQNGDALMKCKGGKMDKEASGVYENGDTGTEEETHEDDTGGGVSVQYRSFDELQNLYPNLAACVERIKAQHPCGETLGRVFGFIGDEEANTLESMIKSKELSVAKAQNRQRNTKKVVLELLLGLME